MKRVALVLVGLFVTCLPARVRGGAAMDDIRKVKIPIYHPETGDLLYLLEAATVTPTADNPKLLDGGSVRITAYHRGKTHVATAKTGSIDVGKRNASLKGDVTVTFGDERASRVETDQLYWHGDKGMATTEPRAGDRQTAEQAIALSTVPVRITRLDMATEGLGLQLWLRDPQARKKAPDRTDRLIIGRNVRTVIAPGSSDWLLRAKSPTPTAGPRAPNRPAAQRGPIIITCSGPLAVYRADFSAVYNGNVRVVQDDQSLKCDTLTISFRPAKKPRTAAEPTPKPKEKPDQKVVLESVTASGNVVIDNTRTIARADLAIWHQQDGFAMLTGRPARVNWDNGNQIAAGRIRRMRGGDELDCSITPDHTQSVYLVALTSAGAAPPTAERPNAP